MKPELEFGLAHAGWPAFVVDASGVIRLANESAVATFGTAMRGGATLAASVWPPDSEFTPEQFLSRCDRSASPMTPLKLRVKGGGTMTFETYVSQETRDGQRFHLLQTFRQSPVPKEEPAPAPPKAVTGDTAHLKAVAAMDPSAQKQKLECALRLARTVALDFNNALTSVLGHTSLVLGKMEPGHSWRPSMLEVEKAAQRAAEIAYDLAVFSRQDKDVRAMAAGNMNDLIRRTVEVFQSPSPLKILWTLQLEKKLFSAKFDEAKLQQALMKILDNAVEAIASEGRITVRTSNQTLDTPVSSPSLQLPAGHYVCIEFTDDGQGIPGDVLPRVFEPFFTTKGEKHRGLGLAWVYGIVSNHGGTVVVTSPPGLGTTVRLFLPAERKIVRDQATRVDNLRGSQTVLFVDDEENLLTLGQVVLSSFGYKVLTAQSGQKALEMFGRAPREIDLVVTDLVMPGMSGRELTDHIRRISPAVPVLSTSGYIRNASDVEEDSFLQKPFTSQDLLRKVKQMIEDAAG